MMWGVPGTRYITKKAKKKKSYEVGRWINGKYVYFGSGRTLIEALMIKDWCESTGWKEKYFTSNTGEKYISLKDGRYYITKWINGKLCYFGGWKTLEQAIDERNLFIKCEWDLDAICEGVDERVNGMSVFNNRRIL